MHHLFLLKIIFSLLSPLTHTHIIATSWGVIPQSPTHTVTSRKALLNSWRTVFEHTIHNSVSNKTVTYEIIDQKGEGAVTIFAFDTRTKLCTLIREYQPGGNSILFGTAAGLIESKHSSVEDAAISESNEELQLKNGTLLRLTARPIIHDKYSSCKFHCFLLLDAVSDDEAAEQDAEEEIEVIRGLTIAEVKDLARGGEMNVVGVAACLLAIDKLDSLKLL
tara:strand:- start:58 stop:720 length:663 start_codon:yes stop_codon:yes gene_type:complete